MSRRVFRLLVEEITLSPFPSSLSISSVIEAFELSDHTYERDRARPLAQYELVSSSFVLSSFSHSLTSSLFSVSMGVHLPPEILLLILDISLPTWPFIDFYGDYDGDFEWPREKPGYLQRYRALCRFALVHRTWLPLVRTLKVQYLFFDGNWPIERYLALKIRRDTLGGARTLGVSLNNGSRPDNALRLLHGKNQEIKYLETAEPLSSSTFAALTRECFSHLGSSVHTTANRSNRRS